MPDVVIRTTVMVGFPGETEEDFNKLYSFIERAKFDKLGAFSYSKEEGTAAEKMPNQVHPSTKRGRYNKIMKLQNKISTELQNELIGKELEVLIESKTFDNKYYVGRSYREVPEIDGVIYVEMVDKALEGKFVKVEITDSTEYDLIGKIK